MAYVIICNNPVSIDSLIDRLKQNGRLWKQRRLKDAIRKRLANPVDTSGHANLETYIWACENNCVNGWNFKTRRYEGRPDANYYFTATDAF